MAVAVFGAGVAGMSVAHELAQRGIQVTLYERKNELGGKARSFGKPGTGTGGRQDLPGEHGFRFFPGFYKHIPDVMRRIPKPGGGTVFDNLVSVETSHIYFDSIPPLPIPANLAYVNTPLEFATVLAGLFDVNELGLDPDDGFFFAERMICALGSCEERRANEYEKQSWEQYIRVANRSSAYKRVFSEGLARPLVAMNPAQTNARTALTVMLQILQNMVMPNQTADRILNDPTSVAWIEPWRQHLATLGVNVVTGATLTGIDLAGGNISNVKVEIGGTTQSVAADAYVFAIPHEALEPLLTAQIKASAPSLAKLNLLQNAWMTGLLFYFTGTPERIDGHGIYADSEWALTSIWQLQHFDTIAGHQIGAGNISAILSTIISNWDRPGKLGKVARLCSLNEIRQEVLDQLNDHLKKSAGGVLNVAGIVDSFLDPAIQFGNSGAVSGNLEQLLINTVDSWKNRPEAVNEIGNMYLASDYVRTRTNLATMEGACEAGRAAATHILVKSGYTGTLPSPYPLTDPPFFDVAKALDSQLFTAGLPQLCLNTMAQIRANAQSGPRPKR